MNNYNHTLEAMGRLLMHKTAGTVSEEQFTSAIEPMLKEASMVATQRSFLGGLGRLFRAPMEGAGALLMNSTAKSLKGRQQAATKAGLSEYGGGIPGIIHRIGHHMNLTGRAADLRAAGIDPSKIKYKDLHRTALDADEAGQVYFRTKKNTAARNAEAAASAENTAAQNASAAADAAQQHTNNVPAQGNGVVENAGMRLPSMPMGNAALGAAGLLGVGALAHKKMQDPQYPPYPHRPMIMMM